MGEDATMGEAKPERTSGVSLDIVKVSLSRVLLFSFVLSSFSHFFSICFLFLPSPRSNDDDDDDADETDDTFYHHPTLPLFLNLRF